MRKGAPGGDVDDGEPGGVARLHAGALRLDHLAVRIGAAVVLVHGGRQAETAGEQARRGVHAHDLRTRECGKRREVSVDGGASERKLSVSDASDDGFEGERRRAIDRRSRSSAVSIAASGDRLKLKNALSFRVRSKREPGVNTTSARTHHRRETHRVLGGAEGPVRLDAHVTLDGDSLQIAIARGGWGVGQSPRRDARGLATRDFFVAGEMTRHCRDAVLRRAGGASRTFLAAKDFFAPANWGRTAVAEAMACMIFERRGSVERFVC